MDLSAENSSATQPKIPQDSATTQAEKTARHGENGNANLDEREEPPAKRVRLNENVEVKASDAAPVEAQSVPQPRTKGQAPIKAEYLIPVSTQERNASSRTATYVDDDDAEASRHTGADAPERGGKRGKKEKNRGQNKARDFGNSRDDLPLCSTRTFAPEFSPEECRFGAKCKFEHDLRKYLEVGKRNDLTTFDGVCPVWNLKGKCDVGWKCRFAKSHSEERDVDGKKELVLVEDPERIAKAEASGSKGGESGVFNVISQDDKMSLSRKRFKTTKADPYIEWLNTQANERRQEDEGPDLKEDGQKGEREDNRARYAEPPLLPSEKRRIYYGPETPILAPLTTQGNLPFRRLCVGLGAQVTWSEMAMGLPLINGEKGEWALMRGHESEASPPKFSGAGEVVQGYDNSKDLKFGAQIAAHKPWLALKTVEVLGTFCSRLRAIDLNCGCPIDLVFRQGSGSALLDSPSKLEKMLKGMNAVSGEIPITVKIRMGTKDNTPTADKLVKRLVFGGPEADSPCGVAAITLHGRSRQQRYSRSADWNYISECAAMIKRIKDEKNDRMDTGKEPDARFQAADGKVYFVGNGDCLSHVDYNRNIQEAKVDSVMVGRGALIKPWVFEEIEKGQYLDKSASERLAYVESFVKYGLEAWGSDEMGVGTTRRFLLEWLSFACRYIPVGLLEHLPPNIQDRPPRYHGRNDLETLMSSDNYKDWIKISEMFLGPAHPNFRFEPKHKSSSYEIEAEG